MKLAGALAIAAAGAAACWQYLAALRLEIKTLRALIAALNALEGMIRWKQTALPDGLRELTGRTYGGKYFAEAVRQVESGIPLQYAWKNAFSDFSFTGKDTIIEMCWVGDAEQIRGTIRYTSERLAALCQELEAQRSDREKVAAAGLLSVSGVVIVMLL